MYSYYSMILHCGPLAAVVVPGGLADPPRELPELGPELPELGPELPELGPTQTPFEH